MYKVAHISSDREEYIHEMHDRHLENYINLELRKMNELRMSSSDQQQLFGMDFSTDKERAEKLITEIMSRLEPYLTELVIRRNTHFINNISPLLERVLKRNEISDVGKNLLS